MAKRRQRKKSYPEPNTKFVIIFTILITGTLHLVNAVTKPVDVQSDPISAEVSSKYVDKNNSYRLIVDSEEERYSILINKKTYERLQVGSVIDIELNGEQVSIVEK